MEPHNKHSETAPDEYQNSVLDLDPDDPELAAWLAAREADLEEMAWARLEQSNDRSWQ